MRADRVIVLLAAALAAASACGDGQESATSGPSPTAMTTTTTTTTTAAAAPTTTANGKNQRGNRVKVLGEKAGAVGCPTDVNSCDIVFTLDRVTGCTGTGYHGDAVDGVRRIVWFTVTTSPAYGTTEWSGNHPAATFNSGDMKWIGPNGAARPVSVSSTWQCVPEQDQFPQYDAWQRGTTYVGGMEIVVREPTGTLVLSPEWMAGEGWEWAVTS